MNLSEAQQILADAGQPHVLAFWDRLDEAARARLLDQIASIDWSAVAHLRSVLADHQTTRPPDHRTTGPLAPAPVVEL
ncbi:MAG: hypothetical protein II839_13490, partial [Kiritimatiellae bacterium]|nr:hypothetical protein [Kiritimatiellia bacterium]